MSSINTRAAFLAMKETYAGIVQTLSQSSSPQVLLFTVPSTPAGNGRAILRSHQVRIETAITGTGSIAYSLGTTAGGSQILAASSTTTITSANVAESTIDIGLFSYSLPAGASVYCNFVPMGTFTPGQIKIYARGDLLP